MITCRTLQFALVYSLAAVLLGSLRGDAADLQPPSESLRKSSIVERQSSTRHAPNAYCGLHCVYSVLSQGGVYLEFETLLTSKYLSSPRGGSTAGELIQALSDHGSGGHFVPHMAIDRLIRMNRPVILHVRSPGAGARYHHWILFLGGDASGIRVYDPPRDVGEYTVDELLAIWDGTAIVTERSDVTAGNTRLSSKPFAPWVSVTSVTVMLAMIFTFAAINGRRKLSFTLPLAVGACASLLAHTLLPWGFFHGDSGLQIVRSDFYVTTLPVIDYDTLITFIDDDDSAVIDTRPEGAFARDHLPRASNIPIGSGRLRLMHAARDLSDCDRVVVYCQSESCGWAESIGSQLKALGLENVVLYPGGMNEWRLLQESIH
mgnify:CR=1 FL=1